MAPECRKRPKVAARYLNGLKSYYQRVLVITDFVLLCVTSIMMDKIPARCVAYRSVKADSGSLSQKLCLVYTLLSYWKFKVFIEVKNCVIGYITVSIIHLFILYSHIGVLFSVAPTSY